ncbi:hypothetical protein DdX_18399 [Ditylenchus destructor]|uniref:Uncharacterized protein n=1 Tax=Ditylenchus destructor TaxID=166010 RepID=A0AAD4QUY3_9BILA|nr:hypothetical protein DdX_18399 [Ditylenchus destructor]
MLKKIDEASANSISSALGFFQPPPTNTSVSSCQYREVLTSNPVHNPADIGYVNHFKIYPGSNFVDLSKAYLYTEMKIEKKGKDGNWVNIAKGDNISIIQGIGVTFAKNIRVLINGREVSNYNGLLSYKNYLDYELSFSPEAKQNYLGVIGWQHSGTGVNPHNPADNGYVNRAKMFKESKVAQFYSKLNFELANQELWMVPNLEIEIEIHPHRLGGLEIDPKDADTSRSMNARKRTYVQKDS